MSVSALLLIGLHTEALVAAVGAGQTAGVGSMARPEHLSKGRLEHFMALWADVCHMAEIVHRDEYAQPDDDRQPRG